MAKRFSGEKGFTSEDLRTVILDVAGPAHARDMRLWTQALLETTVELDYAEALDWFGLRMTAPPSAPRPWLGIATRVENQKTIVSGIRRGSPAAAAGLSLLDEIVAVNGAPAAARSACGSPCAIFARRNRELHHLPIGRNPADRRGSWNRSRPRLEPERFPRRDSAQRQRLDAWLH